MANVVHIGDYRKTPPPADEWWFTLSVWWVGDRANGELGGRIEAFADDALLSAHERLLAYADAMRAAADDFEQRAERLRP